MEFPINILHKKTQRNRLRKLPSGPSQINQSINLTATNVMKTHASTQTPLTDTTLPVRMISNATTSYLLAYVHSGMLFNYNESGQLEAFLCERTVADTGIPLAQFKHMIELEGFKAMLTYYPDAFLRLGQNRYVRCELLPYAMKQHIEAA